MLLFYFTLPARNAVRKQANRNFLRQKEMLSSLERWKLDARRKRRIRAVKMSPEVRSSAKAAGGRGVQELTVG